MATASESKPFQSRSKGEIPGRTRRKERLSHSKLKQAFLIDSDAELFVYLIQFIRLGSWIDRRPNRALLQKFNLNLITDSFANEIFKITLNILIITYFQPSVGLIIPETSLSLNSKQDDIYEI